MRNVSQIISSHNKRIITPNQTPTENACNCRIRATCPLNGNCLARDIIYKATVTSNEKKASYIGLASGQFKMRYNNHTKSFRNERYKKESELSKYIWDLKTKNAEYTIAWEIRKHSNTTQRPSGQCNLCLAEKCEILFNKGDHTQTQLNKRSELISKCRHSKKAINRAKKKR